jgi:hypothetical protein
MAELPVPLLQGRAPHLPAPFSPSALVVGARGGLLWRCLPVPWRPALHSSPSMPLYVDPCRYSVQQQPSLALSSTSQHRHCPCLSAVQIPATSLAEHCPQQHAPSPCALGARRIAAASHAPFGFASVSHARRRVRLRATCAATMTEV